MESARQQKWVYLFGYLVVATVVVTCLSLSVWQLKRAEQKKELLAAVPSGFHSIKTSLNRLQTLPIDKLNGDKLTVEGELNSAHVWYLDNQIFNSLVGVDVLALLKVAELDAYLLVNLGFIATQNRQLPTISLPEQKVGLELVTKTKSLKGFTLAQEPNLEKNQPNLIQFIDIPYLSKAAQLPIIPAVFYQQNSPALIGQPHYKVVVMPPEKHHAYALQWFLLACAACVVAIKLNKRRQEHA